MKKILSLLFIGTLIFGMAEFAKATPITFTGSSGSLSASVTFDISGSNLLVTLTNTSTGDPGAPGDILSGVIFAIPGNPALTKISAQLAPGSIVLHGPNPATNPTPSGVGGEWAYTNALVSPFTGQQSLYSAGYFNGNATFPGNNLQGPASVDGIQYGITTLFDLPANNNGGISGVGLIQNSVVFVLGGLPPNFNLNGITNVSFQYGTSLDETNFPGTPPGSPVPEPTTMLLLGSGLIGLWGFRKKFKK